MSKTKSFIRQTIAAFKGDTDKVLAERNYRKARAAFETQIAQLRAKEVEQEAKVEEAKEALDKALYRTTAIGDGQSYVRDYVDAKDYIKKQEEMLENIKNSIKEYQSVIAEFDMEVEGISDNSSDKK